MTDQEINLEIAKLCGWQPHYSNDGFGSHPIHAPAQMDRMPNYCHDLNAMHEAEKWLNANQANLYRKLLTGLTNIAYTGSAHPHLCYSEHATAHQRAEAFLRTLNKWKD